MSVSENSSYRLPNSSKKPVFYAPSARRSQIVVSMVKGKFGVAVDEGIVREVNALVAECGVSESAAPRSAKPYSQQLFNPRRATLNRCEKSLYGNERGLCLADSKLCALSAHSFKMMILPQ